MSFQIIHVVFWNVGKAPDPFEVRTCHALPTVPLCNAPVEVVHPKIGAYAVILDTPVPQSETETSVPPGA